VGPGKSGDVVLSFTAVEIREVAEARWLFALSNEQH
jgi:hypothetical protein